MPSSGVPDQITSSPKRARSGNSARVDMVAAITFSFPITIEPGDLTIISGA